MLAARGPRGEKPPAQEPETPDAKANQVVSRFEADPFDQSGRTRADLNGMESGERAAVLGRVQEKVSGTQFQRIEQVTLEAGPRSPEAPPKEIQPGPPPEELAPPEAPEVEPTGEEEGAPEEEKVEARAPGEAPEKPKPAEEARKPEDKKPGPEPAKAAAKAKKADTTRGEKPAEQKASEKSARDKAKGEEEASKAAQAGKAAEDQKAQLAAGRASQPGQDQASRALSALPAEAKGPGTEAPIAPGAPARQAAAQGGPAVVATGAGVVGGGGAEAAVEEGPAERSPEEEAADATEEKIAGAAAPEEEEKELEPPEADVKTESEADLKKQPASEDQEAIRQAEQERQEQARNPQGAEAVAPAEEEQELPPAERAELDPAEARAGLNSLAEGAGGGEPSGGGGGGGGAIAEQPEPEPPKVESLPPVAAVSAISGLKVGQISGSLAGVQTAVSGTMGTERSGLAANAPSMERPSGSPRTREGPIEFPGGPAGKAKVEETPEGEAVPVEAPEPLPDPGPSPTDQVSPPPIQGGGEGGTLTQADADNVEAAVDEVPTTDPALSETAGPPPTVELVGEANPQQAADQRAKLDQSIVEQQQQGAQDAAEPMGENEIYPVVPKETLTAKIPEGGGGAAGAAPPGVDDETTAIVAEEKQGDEVRASAQQASSDMQAGEEEHAASVEHEKADHETKVGELERENAAQQSDARNSAGRQVQQLRGKWSQGQQQAVDKAQGDADAAQETMSGEVEAQRDKGNRDAAAEIEKGNADAAKVKEKAESDAERKKAEAKSESSGGILGWIASKAKAFFEGLKKAVHAVFDLARKALKTLIDGVKKLAAAAIDLARNAIISAIRLAGKALIAIGDVALAAFPELRDKFRGYIQDKVKAAEDTVNRLADALKEGINKLLDLLGAALEGLLNLLEKAYMAAIDVVANAVQGAIRIAQAAIALLGVLAAIIKDVASGPMKWLSNLGAAVIDGIKNHLWKAFKEAVKNWFNSKLEEVLGLGMAIFNILLKGGIKLADVGKMAFEGLKAAIPVALIGILVEKLVAMIVPAAGALMAIIEGLQAAWGAISRILQAIEKFVSFLKAVKTGSAGPQFAQALAGSAIVVIDFVANWLIRNLRGPAAKIGGKIKAIAKRILEKLKAVAKKVAGAVKRAFKKVAAKIKGAFKKVKEKLFGKKKKDKKGKAKRKEDEDKKKKKQKKIEEAIAKTKSSVEQALAKGTRPLVMKARLAYLKLRYGWQGLSLNQQGSAYIIKGHINPDFDLPANVSFKELTVHVSDLNIDPNKIAALPGIDRPPSRSGMTGGMKPAEFAQAAVVGGALSGLAPGLEGGGAFRFLGQGSSRGRLEPTNPNIDPSRAPAGRAFLGERQYPVKSEGPLAPGFAGVESAEKQLAAHAAVEINKPKPDAVVVEMAGGQLIRSVNIEATLDGELSQGHKESQLYRTIIAAQEVYSRFPAGTVSLKDLEIHYVIIAPKAAEAAKGKLQAQFDQLKGKVASKVTVTWIYVQGLG
ncbi:MAG: hypothetical protein KIT09_34500 [Bryobacteraceae bacterium]|nr:hypothetical protein [Bryobacteraceae bacterium]